MSTTCKTTIQWKQTDWFTPKGSRGRAVEKKPWRWQGNRPDGRSFKITYISRLERPYRATSFNGLSVGDGKTLAEAQAVCENVPKATVPVKVPKA